VHPDLSLHCLRLRRPSALLWLLLAALLLRGMLAPGFMPQPGAKGFAVVLCTVGGARTVWTTPEAAHEASSGCAYAMAVGMAALPAPASSSPALLPAATRDSPRPAQRLSIEPARAYRARAPPLLS